MGTPDYFVASSVFSAMGFAAGFIVGTGYAARFNPKGLDMRKRERLLGAALIFIALIATAQSLVFQRHQRSITECQARYNEQFQRVLKDRASIADRDRGNTDKMVQTVLVAKRTEDVRAALELYVKTNASLTKERANSPFPQVASKTCK